MLNEIENVSADERITKHSPRFAILTDYKTLVAKDLKLKKNLDIKIAELPKYFDFFLPLAGSEVYNTSNDNQADRDAACKMAQLYDNLVHANGNIYNSKESIHELSIFLSRLLFCYFAEACLNVDLFDDKGQRITPREWFVVPLQVIEEAIQMILRETIIDFEYNAKTQTIERK